MEEDEDPSTPKKQRRKRKPKNFEPDTPVDSEEEIEEEKKKKRGRKKKKVEPALEEKEELTDVQQTFQIVEHLMSSGNATAFLSRPDDTNYGMADYYEIISKPMWFKEVERRYRDEEYQTPTEIATDVRQMLENCYQYWGPNDQLSKKALKIEQMFETKLASLPESLQEQCSLMATHGNIIKDEPDENLTRKNNNKKGGYVSKLMNWVLSGRGHNDGDTPESTKELDAVAKARKAEREAADKQLTLWELDHLLTPGVKEQIASMWEFPVIGQFLHLVYNVLNIDAISHLELERMLLMPQASKTLATLLTSMLIPPLFRAKLEVGPAMPYSIWSRRLHTKVTSWYRTFRSKGDSTIEVFDSLGIEPQFWLVMGEENPLNDYEFHELTFLQRVWLLKALCDFLLHNHKTIQECINNLQMKELRNKNLGRDREGFSYHYFPMFPELRIYKMAKVPDAKWKNYEAGVEEAIAMCAEEEDDEDLSQEPNLLGLTRRPLHKPPRSMRPSHSDFRLVCETLEDVRRLVNELCEPEPPQTEGLRRLVANLRGILRDLESREAKMQLAAFNVRNRMRDEWIQFKNKSADYVDPGLAYWERKEKEEKKAGEEKLTDMSLPGTSSDGALPNEEKRERRTRRESSLKLLSREDDDDDESAAESLLDFDDDSEDEWFASKKDKEMTKKKKRSLSVKKLKKLSDLSDRMQHSTAAKDKLSVNSSSNSGSKSSIINTNMKISNTADPPVKIKQELPDFDEIANNIHKPGHNNSVGNQNNSNKSSNDSGKNKPNLPMPIKQEIMDEPPVTTLSSPTIKNTTSVIQTLVPVKVEKLTKPPSNTLDLSRLKRSNSPDDVVYISDSEDPPDVKPNPVLLMQRVNSNKVETINYSMSVPQQQQVGGFLVAGSGQNPGQFVPVNVTPGDQVFNSQPQLFNVAQPQPTQPVAYQMQTPAIVQQPIIRPSPTIVRMQATPPRGAAPGQKFMVIQPNANNVNPSNQFSNKNSQPQGNSFPTTPTMQSVNWFGPRGAQQNFSPRQRGQSTVSPRGRGSPRSPMTPTRGGQRFAVRTPPNSVRTPGSVIRTPTQMGVRSPAQLRGRGATTPVRPSPVRNLNFNRSPVKPANDVPPTDNSPDIEGTLVVSMTESGAFGYVVMLPDGGKISLTQDQLAKIRSDNGGTLPKTCKVPLNMQSEGFRID